MTVKSNFETAGLSGKLKISCLFIRWEVKPKPINTLCDFSCALSRWQIIAKNFDWFITLSAPVVVGQNNNFGVCFSKVI